MPIVSSALEGSFVRLGDAHLNRRVIYFQAFKWMVFRCKQAAEGGWLRVPAMQKAFFPSHHAVYSHQHIDDVDACSVYSGQVVGTRHPKALLIVPLGICFNATYFRKRSLG